MLSHKQLVKKMLTNPAVKAHYDAQKEEFALFDELVKARAKAGLTQAEVAERMGTQVPAISRLESGARNPVHSPSIATLQRYAEAVGCRLVVKLAPKKKATSVRSPSLKRAA
jgi:transcriptional regulator with XRE-family HTH domain